MGFARVVHTLLHRRAHRADLNEPTFARTHARTHARSHTRAPHAMRRSAAVVAAKTEARPMLTASDDTIACDFRKIEHSAVRLAA